MFYMNHECKHYRCSSITHVFGLLFPACVILYMSLHRVNRYQLDMQTFVFFGLLYASHCMFMFHIMHELNNTTENKQMST